MWSKVKKMGNSQAAKRTAALRAAAKVREEELKQEARVVWNLQQKIKRAQNAAALAAKTPNAATARAVATAIKAVNTAIKAVNTAKAAVVQKGRFTVANAGTNNKFGLVSLRR